MVQSGRIFLLYGGTGWIGQQLTEILNGLGERLEIAKARIEDREAIVREVDRVNPTHVLHAAGLTGRPNVDWCETHKEETIRVNVMGCLNLADVCSSRGIHMTYYGTGCIYEYNEDCPVNSGQGFTETDPPNFTGSFYSETKVTVEKLIRSYKRVLTLRLRMPVVADLLYPRNFITKIMKYDKVIDIPNSMTVLPELLPLSIEMAKCEVTGVFNFTNPGAISHNEVLQMYKDHIDNDFTWSNFSIEDQAKVLAAPRSNNRLDTEKIQELFPNILSIKESIFKYAIQPNMAKKCEARQHVRRMRGRV